MKKRVIIASSVIVVLLCTVFGWKLPIILQIESLNLPEGYEVIYNTKVHISDVYWPHIMGEKVIKCDMDYEEVEQYIKEHNSSTALTNIGIVPYAGMSDIAIYNSEFDDEFWEQPDADHYITIRYFRKISE